MATFMPDPQLSQIYGVRLVEGDLTEQFLATIPGPIGISRWQELRETFDDNARLTVIVLSSFAVFALLAVGIVLANVVSGQILAQHREIGLLKAIGFTPRQTAVLFGGQALVLGAAATAVGVLIGVVTAPWWLRDVAAELGQSAAPDVTAARLAIVAGLVVGSLLLFTLIPAWHAGRVPVVQAIRGGLIRPDSRPSRMHRVASHLPLPRPVVTGLKDLFSRPVRTWLTIGAMGLGAATVMFTLTVDATVDRLVREPEVVGEATYDLRATRLTSNAFDLTASEPDRVLSEDAALEAVQQDGVVGVVRVRQFGSTISGAGSYVSRSVEGDLDFLRTQFRDGGWPVAPDEIAIGFGLAEQIGVHVGDTIDLSVPLDIGSDRVDRRSGNFKVSGIHIEGANSGEIVIFSGAAIERLVGPVAFSELWLILDDDANSTLVAQTVRAAAGGRMPVSDEAAATRSDLESASRDLRAVLFPLNVVLLVIAGVNLLTALLFTVRERRREFALLKTIGFTPRQVAVAVSAGAVVTAVAGAAVGAPLGFIVTSQLVDYFGGEDGWPSGVAAAPALPWFGALVAIAVGVAILGAWLPARQAALTDIKSALRHE